jgi:hypothetical protein
MCPDIQVPASPAISELLKKVHLAGSFLDKKYTRQNTVLRKSVTTMGPLQNISPQILNMISSTGTSFNHNSMESD